MTYDYVSYFVISYFHIFLLWFIELRLGYSDIHILKSDTSHWLACRPIRSLPAHHLTTVPSVRTRSTMELCIVSHYHYHTRALRHVRRLLTDEVAQTVARSIAASRLDYCNALLHGAPAATIVKLQRVQNNLARVVRLPARWPHRRSAATEVAALAAGETPHHVEDRGSLLTNKVLTTSTPPYLHDGWQTISTMPLKYEIADSCHGRRGDVLSAVQRLNMGNVKPRLHVAAADGRRLHWAVSNNRQKFLHKCMLKSMLTSYHQLVVFTDNNEPKIYSTNI